MTNWLIERRESTVHLRFAGSPLELQQTIELIDSLEASFADQTVARIVVDGDAISGDKRAIRATLVALATHSGVWGKEFEFRADIVQVPEIAEIALPSK